MAVGFPSNASLATCAHCEAGLSTYTLATLSAQALHKPISENFHVLSPGLCRARTDDPCFSAVFFRLQPYRIARHFAGAGIAAAVLTLLVWVSPLK